MLQFTLGLTSYFNLIVQKTLFTLRRNVMTRISSTSLLLILLVLSRRGRLGILKLRAGRVHATLRHLLLRRAWRLAGGHGRPRAARRVANVLRQRRLLSLGLGRPGGARHVVLGRVLLVDQVRGRAHRRAADCRGGRLWAVHLAKVASTGLHHLLRTCEDEG